MLTELELMEMAYMNNVPYYKIKDEETISKPSQFSIEFELLKFKKLHLTTSESHLRQIKLLQSIRSSGEEDKLIELIDKWENASREVIKELFDHQAGGGLGSIKKFVTKLGLRYEDLGFDEEDEDEGEDEQDENIDYNSSNYIFNTFSDKRIKYDD